MHHPKVEQPILLNFEALSAWLCFWVNLYT